jgi:uncharacterized lipoprotein YehR (DUF1307 family)
LAGLTKLANLMGSQTFATLALVVIALVLSAILAGCGSFSFRVGELSFDGEPSDYTTGVEGPSLK